VQPRISPKLTEFETDFIAKIYECAFNLYENKDRIVD